MGRSNACDYSLNDASRYISSNHAIVSLENGQLYIQDTSANGVYVNGSADPIGRGRTVALNDNDSLAIGDYTVIANIDQGASNSPSNASPDDPFADFATGGSPTPAAAPAFDPFKGDEPDWTPPSAQSDDPFGDDWDMNDTPTPAAPNSRDNAPPADSGGDWADWDSPSSPNPPPARAPAPPPTAESAPVKDPFATPDDDFDWLPGTSNETISIPPSLPESSPQPRNPAVSPRQRRAPSPVSRPPPPQAGYPANRPAQSTPRVAQPPRASDSHEGLSALLTAAKLRESDFAHQSEAEVLAQTGRLLNQMVDAMMVLLQSRAEVKNAMRSDVTQLSRANNNPLKFSFSSSDALTKLLSDNTDGYLHADASIQEAVDDLKLHQLAMLEGMKAAVRSMLLQFDPGKLEKTLEKTGGISANIPITREAKLWELFCEQYDAIREEAVSDFGELFGAEFRKAYEKRIRKLGRQPDF